MIAEAGRSVLLNVSELLETAEYKVEAAIYEIGEHDPSFSEHLARIRRELNTLVRQAEGEANRLTAKDEKHEKPLHVVAISKKTAIKLGFLSDS